MRDWILALWLAHPHLFVLLASAVEIAAIWGIRRAALGIAGRIKALRTERK